MKIQQLSVFLENKPGQMAAVFDILGKSSVNIITMSTADTEQFGILRIITPEWEKAKTVLEKGQFVVNLTPVIAIQVPHKPGGLSSILALFQNQGINIEYMYAFPCAHTTEAVLIARFEDPCNVADVINATSDFKILSEADVFKEKKSCEIQS
ncbi:acetolactate synthase 3 regulatory subunit [Poriferisphaera corsica]|uniref:Acetolactate synthase 3 regulatory subunit n=1 Tax=Poriferisphaera corsica TaxID=2528020 RepID=A0A517YPF1_9BACT|nr:amino acid-binding protein [Poriferisphaera corsica]QDU32082.1 acetolactate synthase 3 regulatory subunit [Poriferisphaera corsica]